MTEIMRALWIGGLAATPLALAVGVVCRAKAWSAATRHLLWLAVLASFVTPAIGLFVWRPNWFGTEQILGAAEHVIAQLPTTTGATEQPGADLPRRNANASSNQSVPETTFVGPVMVPTFTPESAARFAGGTPTGTRTGTGEARLLSASPVSASLPRHAGQGGYSSNISTLGTVNSAAPLGLAPMGTVLMDQPVRARLVENPPRSIGADQAPRVSLPRQAPVATTPINESSAKKASSNEPPVAGFVRKVASALVSMRDSLASASPIPMTLWLGVAAALISLRVARTIRASGLIRQSEPASLRTCAMVAVAAEQIGLSRIPEARMVNDPISPMIWCGIRPKLILPRGLWNALDESSQRAVLVHELAHVRRWDHLLCWFDLVVGSLYWWHPLSWWARRRLHDEAEASCDAWVVNTLPDSRRAYATALLATKSFVSMKGRVSGPWLSGGVGVLSGSAKKMARRITMIMTQKSASRMSLVGAGAAAFVIALGAFVMPGLACPPETKADQERAEKVAAELANSSGVVVVKPGQKVKLKKKDKDGAEAGVHFFGEAPALESMKAKRGAAGMAPMAPMAPMPPAPAAAPSAPRPPTGAFLRVAPRSQATAKSGGCSASRHALVTSGDDLRKGRVARVYALPPGKSEALWELLSRGDVPILVQQKGRSIVVYATEAQHPIIAGFIKIINPDGAGSQGSGRSSTGSAGRGESALRMSPNQGDAFRSQMRAYEQALRELNTSRETIERNADRMREEADRVRTQHEHLHEMTEHLHQQAQELEAGDSRQAVERAADELRQRAEEMEQRARSTDSQVEQIERQIEEIERRAEELENRISDASDEGDESIAEIDEDEIGSAVMPSIRAGDAKDMGEMIVIPDMDDSDDMDVEGVDDMDDESSEMPGSPVMAPIPAPAFTPAPIPAIAPAPTAAPVIAPAAPVAPAPSPARNAQPVPGTGTVAAVRNS
ncbi:MAG: hypothetical protein KF805_16225 [Phycisphaeraceae bacterium]|nr:hypothetical protein [Phycisphaeraceae bacterium]